MTRTRLDGGGTEFSNWLTTHPELDSKKDYLVSTDIDYIWENYKTGDWMIIEEKRGRGRGLPDFEWSQRQTLRRFYARIVKDDKFKGFHIIQFENTNPEDGKVYLNYTEISKESLIKFMRFELIEGGLSDSTI